MIRKVSREEHKPLCILGDLQGPEDPHLKAERPSAGSAEGRQRLTITPRDVPGTASLVGTTFKTLAENVEQGSRILLSDGLIELRVHEVIGRRRRLRDHQRRHAGREQGHQPARHPGPRSVADRKRQRRISSSPSAMASMPSRFPLCALRKMFAWCVIASQRLDSETWIIAKLEKPQAIEHLDSILAGRRRHHGGTRRSGR